MGFKFGIQSSERSHWSQIENISADIRGIVKRFYFDREYPLYKAYERKIEYNKEKSERLLFHVDHFLVILKKEILALPDIKYDAALLYRIDEYGNLFLKNEDIEYEKIELYNIIRKNQEAVCKLYDEYYHKVITPSEAFKCERRIPGTKKAKDRHSDLKGAEVFCDRDKLPVDEYNYKLCKCEYAEWSHLEVAVFSKKIEYLVKLRGTGMYKEMNKFVRAILEEWDWYGLSEKQMYYWRRFVEDYEKDIKDLPNADRGKELEIVKEMISKQRHFDYLKKPQKNHEEMLTEYGEYFGEL